MGLKVYCGNYWEFWYQWKSAANQGLSKPWVGRGVVNGLVVRQSPWDLSLGYRDTGVASKSINLGDRQILARG